MSLGCFYLSQNGFVKPFLIKLGIYSIFSNIVPVAPKLHQNDYTHSKSRTNYNNKQNILVKAILLSKCKNFKKS
jgi:hypothetical protein